MVPPLDAHNPRQAGWRRAGLWGLLVALIGALVAMLVWLTARYETGQLHEKLEQTATAAAADVRSALLRNVQALQGQALRNVTRPGEWTRDALQLLATHRELVRLELRDTDLAVLAYADSGLRPPVFGWLGRDSARPEYEMACANARRTSAPAYSPSYFVPLGNGLGLQVMELCVRVPGAGASAAFVVATYSLPDALAEMAGGQLERNHQISFTEPDGTRLASHGELRRGGSLVFASHLLDLPGVTFVVRLDAAGASSSLFPDVLSTMVAGMTLALASVLALLVRDSRRRMRAERGLADSLAFRQAMENSLITGLRARDLQGRTTYVNPAFCQMVGLSEVELLGAPLEAPYWPPEHAAQYLQRQMRRLAGSTAPREGHESVFMRRDGSRFAVQIYEAPLLDAAQRHTGWMSAIVDISEQRRVEEVSRASQERLQATARLASVGEMASLLSHELNQPLAAIASYAAGSINLVRSDWHPGTRGMFEEALQQIANQATRAGTVIKSVHDFVRRRDSQRAPVQAQALLDAVMPLVQLQARKNAVHIVTRVAPDLAPVWCDRAMVEQVLLNLTRNAMQAMDHPHCEKRELSLDVRPLVTSGMEMVEFSVADVGVGISEDIRERLFSPFFTTKSEGMGLGLSLCRTVIEQHGSVLTFTDNLPSGTVFRFALAVAPGAAAR